MSFIPNLSLSSSATQRIDYIQAADASEMQELFDSYIAALVAENTARSADQEDPFQVWDVTLAGGGDGHTFVLAFSLSTQELDEDLTVGWADGALASARASFWMGGDAESLGSYQEAAIAALTTLGTIDQIATGHAGASQGTRFMDFAAGIIAIS